MEHKIIRLISHIVFLSFRRTPCRHEFKKTCTKRHEKNHGFRLANRCCTIKEGIKKKILYAGVEWNFCKNIYVHTK
jgi:hypothetical protein